jgi:hypothetical protein
MTHLSPDERLALIEAADAPDHPHLAACARCRAEVEEGRVALGEVRLADVPEPSPLFWEHLSARVSGRMAAEPEAPRRIGARWRVLVPATVGVIAVILAVWIDRRAARAPTPPAPVPGAVTLETTAVAVGDDESWSMLGQLAGELDVDTLSDTLGTSEAAGAENAVSQLSALERARLAELLQAQMGQGPVLE